MLEERLLGRVVRGTDDTANVGKIVAAWVRENRCRVAVEWADGDFSEEYLTDLEVPPADVRLHRPAAERGVGT